MINKMLSDITGPADLTTKVVAAASGDPVIHLNDQLEPEFFSPAAMANEYILLTPQSIKEGYDAKNIEKLQKCLQTGRAVQFDQVVGLHHKKEYHIRAKMRKGVLCLTFNEKESDVTLSEMLKTVDPDRERLRAALHSLLNTSDYLRKTEQDEYKKRLAEDMNKQTMRAIRIMHLSELPLDKHRFIAADARALLDRLCKAAASYVAEHTPHNIEYHPIEGECAIKCCPSLMRDILYNSMAMMMLHTGDDLSVNCSYMGNTLMINILTCGKAGSNERSGAVLEPGLFGLKMSEQLTRMHQGELKLVNVDSNRISLRIVLPCAQIEGAFNKHLGDFLQENLCTEELHFSELI